MTQAGREKLLGGAHVAVAAAGLAVGGFLLLGLAQSDEPNAEAALAFVLWIFITAQVAWLLPGLVGGLGLLWGQGWARGVIGAVSVVLLLLLPVGTALGGAGLWVLFGKEAKAQVRAAPKMLGRGQAFALCAIAAVASLGLMIGLGYLFRDLLETMPRMSRSSRAVAAAIGVAAIVLIVFVASSLRSGLGPTLMPAITLRRMRARKRQKQEIAAHKARLARLAADPALARYAAMISAGDYWSDAQIAYDLDPDRTETCEHLSPIERAMRRAGLVLKPSLSPLHVDARCRIDAGGFDAMEKAPSVKYHADHFILERFGEQIPAPFIGCSLCNSGLHTEAADPARPGAPQFP